MPNTKNLLVIGFFCAFSLACRDAEESQKPTLTAKSRQSNSSSTGTSQTKTNGEEGSDAQDADNTSNSQENDPSTVEIADSQQKNPPDTQLQVTAVCDAASSTFKIDVKYGVAAKSASVPTCTPAVSCQDATFKLSGSGFSATLPLEDAAMCAAVKAQVQAALKAQLKAIPEDLGSGTTIIINNNNNN